MAADLEVLTVGRISIDLYCDQIGADWHAARSFHKAVSGSPTNVAIACARLGRNAVFTKVGSDAFGEAAIAELRDFGVDLRAVGVEHGMLTPLVFAVLDPSGNPQLIFRREPPAPDLQLRVGDVDSKTIVDVSVLWISAGALTAKPSASTVNDTLRLRRGRRHTILDVDYRPSFWQDSAAASATVGAAAALATVAVGNREECAIAVGTDDPHEAARRLLQCGVELAIVKLGGDGVLVASADEEHVIPASPIAALCGLGAVDAFGGALCHGLLSGWPVERAVAFANAAGGIVASRLLCSEAMPYEREVFQLLEESVA